MRCKHSYKEYEENEKEWLTKEQSYKRENQIIKYVKEHYKSASAIYMADVDVNECYDCGKLLNNHERMNNCYVREVILPSVFVYCDECREKYGMKNNVWNENDT